MKGQWDEQASRFKKDKRVNPNYENYNALLNRYEVRKDEILRKFMEERVHWTLNQFEKEFLGMSKQGKVYDYFMRQVEKANQYAGGVAVPTSQYLAVRQAAKQCHRHRLCGRRGRYQYDV